MYLKENVSTTIKYVRHSTKALYGGEFLPLNTFIRKEKKAQFHNCYFLPQETRKIEHNLTKTSKRMGKIR